MKTIRTRINFSGKEFQDEFNNNTSLPSFEEVSEEVIAVVDDQLNIIETSHPLSYIDETYIRFLAKTEK